MLKVENLNVAHYGGVQVLWNVSLRVEQNEFVTIVGSNGAGKSTLMYTIAGIYRPTSGSVTWRGERIDTLEPHEIANRGISLVPEGRRIFARMTVLENLKMGSYVKEARKSRNESLQRIFGIFPVLSQRQNQHAETLSGGEQQMLAIARALMARPKIILLDEPSLGLSPLLIKKIFNIIEEFRKQDISILLVEQNVRSALRMADRAYVLENGRIELEGKDLLSDEEVKKAYLGTA